MRPGSPPPQSVAKGFLRSRGDAPTTATLSSHVSTVPPLTRRCAVGGSELVERGVGSSAHAEMRPPWACRPAPPSRFLRSRGDAPVALDRGHARDRVPPLTRRCADFDSAGLQWAGGSSAHAEMRPCRQTTSPSSSRFLRSRGDAPSPGRDLTQSSRVPPLTRRCAARARPRAGWSAGSSAHAEMRRRGGPRSSPRPWFLRSRGDAPTEDVAPASVREVPPLTRRCARLRAPRGDVLRGSSAHAEMRRASSSAGRSGAWFLRSRGDAPPGATPRARTWTVPPLTRRCAS